MTYSELKDKRQIKMTELSEKVGLFWAFNNEQFKEGTAKNPSEKYTNIGMGGFLPSENKTQFLAGLDELDKWFSIETKKIKKEQVILHELANYECFYTHEIEDACEALDGIYTKGEIREVYKAHVSDNRL